MLGWLGTQGLGFSPEKGFLCVGILVCVSTITLFFENTRGTEFQRLNHVVIFIVELLNRIPLCSHYLLCYIFSMQTYNKETNKNKIINKNKIKQKQASGKQHILLSVLQFFTTLTVLFSALRCLQTLGVP